MKSVISTTIDKDGVAVLTWDMSDSPVNKLNEQSLKDFRTAFQAAVDDATVKGIVIASAKTDFIAGADVEMLQSLLQESPQKIFDALMEVHQLFRFVETCKKPVVAAMSGTTLGGGLELALACHHRVCANDPKIKIGFPEVTLGIFPGAGGTQRFPRLVKLPDALQLLTEGRQIGPAEALNFGIVHKVVAPDSVLSESKDYITSGGSAEQPWDKKGYRLPSGDVHSPQGFETFSAANGLLAKLTYGNYPAPRAILECVYHGLQLDIVEGCTLEVRKFIEIARSDAARNMMRTMFFSLNDANKLKDRPSGVAPQKIAKVGIVGAGLMGSGIAYSSAMAGIKVVLIDSSEELAEKGKAACAKIVSGRVEKGKLSNDKANETLDRIVPTTDYSALSDCSLIVEAVFEDRKVKAEVMAKIDAVIGKGAVLASNTSSLPITSLAQSVSNESNFVGIHFFSPVDKMQLVEVIRGKKTSDEALARALDYVQQIKKTPIVVNDSHGFYTTRVFSTYTAEGIHLLSEGVTPALIENAGRIAGMPMGPLEVADMVGLDTVHKITLAAKADLGNNFQDENLLSLLDEMVQNRQRLGRKNSKGFYDYEGRQKRLWTELRQLAGGRTKTEDVEMVKRRLIVIQAIEAIRCLEEGVVMHPADADVGSVLGWGFCPFYGGIISFVDTVGSKWLLDQAIALAEHVGPRFAPPELLKEIARKNGKFYQHSWQAKEACGLSGKH